MSSFISILSALFLLSLLVTVHEFGHFYAGKKLGFKILDYQMSIDGHHGRYVYKDGDFVFEEGDFNVFGSNKLKIEHFINILSINIC